MAKDLYHYFRIEAGEHLEAMGSGILELETRPDDRDIAVRLLRHAHTLKGAARVVRQPEISEWSHEIEEVLGPIRDDHRAASRDEVNRLLKLVDLIADRVKLLRPPLAAHGPGPVGSQPQVPPAKPSREQAVSALDAVRVEVAELDPLLYGIWEAGISLESLRAQAGTIDGLAEAARVLSDQLGASQNSMADEERPLSPRLAASAEHLHNSLQNHQRALRGVLDRTQRELAQLQDRALQLRLLPANSVFAALERAARDTADALGRRIEFRAVGGENRLDAHILRVLQDALLHVVRNAVSHGIEPSEERAGAGKPPVGRVGVLVERRGNRIAFQCQDDGRGVDIDRIRRVAQDHGHLPSSGSGDLSAEETMELLFRSGISTAGAVTEHAGRGIGLDVVRETVARLSGSVEMRSTPSAGTSIEIIVPVSLESMPILEIEVAGYRTGIPFEAIRQVVMVSQRQIARSPQGDSIFFDGTRLPLLSLRSLMFPDEPVTLNTAFEPVVVIEAARSKAAVRVDRAIGRATVILKPLPIAIGHAGLVLGACLDSSGDPQTVLDPSALAEAAGRSPGDRASDVEKPRARILVVDDSLTSRMLEQSILEAAGYDVDTAMSGEDALEKVRRQEYAALVVDVEMPGISGFDFIAKVKAIDGLRETPAILVTSRAGAEDRARGEAVGAAAYIVKGEFEEAGFLQTIRRLIRTR